MTTIYLRDVPEDVHKRAKLQAVMEGISLKALILKALDEYLTKKGGWSHGN
jgi:predicted HicB family RNase H-like nuclease